MQKKNLIKIFLVILADITAFGMVIPLTPILARSFGEESFKIGLLISAYSMVQFLFAPFWGRLSDRFGRRQVLLLGFLGSCLAHLFFAFSESFQDIIFSRILAGCFGGNVVIASAYISDITSPSQRSKNLGLIGMAFGAGFTLGPLLGFLFIILGSQLGDLAPFGVYFASMGASFLCILNFFFSLFFLEESLSSKKNLKSVFKNNTLFKRPSLGHLWASLKTPHLGLVLIMSFILWFSLAHIEPVLILLVQDDFSWSKKLAYSSFIYIGMLMVLTQSWIVRQWIPKWGESFVNLLGLIFMSLGLIGIGVSIFFIQPGTGFFSLAFFILFFGVTGFSVGYSLSSTCLNGTISLLTSSKVQGGIFGVNQSLSSMARIFGPALGGWVYQNVNHQSPFLFAGFLSLLVFFIAFFSKEKFPNKGKQ
ncbi:MAG: MFS transporter [Bdellovibrionales bacterium]|nr:MFS transporter [Bdellovibrionales bacterium]